MPILSKSVEVGVDATSLMAIVTDFERYPEWNEGVKACRVLARYDDGRASQLRMDTVVQGVEGTYIQAVHYAGPNQIHTVMQQGNLFKKQKQTFSVTQNGLSSVLTVNIDIEMSMPVPAALVKPVINVVLDRLLRNLKLRAEQPAADERRER